MMRKIQITDGTIYISSHGVALFPARGFERAIFSKDKELVV
jgi:hypothetical protein